MAAAIGTLTGFTGWDGQLHLATRRMAKLPPRPGVDGEAWVYDGWTTEADTITTRHIANDYTAADSDISVARGMMDGLSRTVVDPQGATWSVKVLSAVAETAARSNGGVLVRIVWSMQPEAAP